MESEDVFPSKKSSKTQDHPTHFEFQRRGVFPRYKIDLEGLVSLCKRRGFVFPSGEVQLLDLVCNGFNGKKWRKWFNEAKLASNCRWKWCTASNKKADSLVNFWPFACTLTEIETVCFHAFFWRRSNSNELLKSHRFTDTISLIQMFESDSASQTCPIPCTQIYGGYNGFFDYGPLGSLPSLPESHKSPFFAYSPWKRSGHTVIPSYHTTLFDVF